MHSHMCMRLQLPPPEGQAPGTTCVGTLPHGTVAAEVTLHTVVHMVLHEPHTVVLTAFSHQGSPFMDRASNTISTGICISSCP